MVQHGTIVPNANGRKSKWNLGWKVSTVSTKHAKTSATTENGFSKWHDSQISRIHSHVAKNSSILDEDSMPPSPVKLPCLPCNTGDTPKAVKMQILQPFRKTYPFFFLNYSFADSVHISLHLIRLRLKICARRSAEIDNVR